MNLVRLLLVTLTLALSLSAWAPHGQALADVSDPVFWTSAENAQGADCLDPIESDLHSEHHDGTSGDACCHMIGQAIGLPAPGPEGCARVLQARLRPAPHEMALGTDVGQALRPPRA